MKENTTLMNKTLVVNKVIYKGKIFKAFIVTNCQKETVNNTLKIEKVLAVSDAHLSQSFVIDALLDHFKPHTAEVISNSIEKLLSDANDIQYVLDIIRQEENAEVIDKLFYSAVNALSVEDIVIL